MNGWKRAQTNDGHENVHENVQCFPDLGSGSQECKSSPSGPARIFAKILIAIADQARFAPMATGRIGVLRLASTGVGCCRRCW
jgi:hypothetical protein